MADPKIYIRRSATPNKVPTTNQLALGELAINTYDGKLYLEKDPGGVGVGTTVVAVNPWTVGVGSLAYDTYFTAGNVGINTPNPTKSLDVRGDGEFQNLYIGKDYVFNGSPLQITNKGQDLIRPNGRILLRSSGTIDSSPTIELKNNAGITIYGGSSSNGVTISGGAQSGASGGDVKVIQGNFLVGTATSTGTANQELQVDSGAYISGSVGIGSTQPTATLDVNGTLNVSGVVTANAFSGNFSVTQTTTNGSFYPLLVNSSSSGDRQLFVDNGQLSYNPSTNTLDLFKLVSYESITLNDNVELNFGSVSSSRAWFNYNGTGKYLELQLESNATDFRITDNGTERFRFDKSAGNLGIGSTQPTANLDVNGTVNISGVSTFQSDIDVRSFNAKFGTSTGSQLTINGNGGTINKANGNIILYGGGTANSEVGIINNFNIYLKPKNGGVELYYGKTDKKLETTGVGVNVTGILTATEFHGNGSNITGIVSISDSSPSSPQAGDLWWESDTGDLKVYYDESKVGAGTSAFWVSTNGADTAVAISTDAPSPATSGDLWWDSNTGNLFLYYDDGDSAQWVDANGLAGAYPWVITGAGIHTTSNVGIGTENPQKELEVVGDAKIGIDTSQGVILTSPNGTEYRLIVDNSGNLSTVAV